MALTRTESHKYVYKKLRIYTWLYSLFVVAVILALLFTVVLHGIKIDGSGMAPSIQDGDVILFSSLSKHIETPARGSVIAYRTSTGYVETGRVIGLPSESVTIRGGSVYINSLLLCEDYTANKPMDMETIALERGCFFVLPDDRSELLLSEKNAQTLVIPFESIIGRAAIRVAPFDRICIFS